MKNKHYALIASIFLFFGMIFFAYCKEWLIIRNPYNTTYRTHTQLITHSYKKTVALIYWHNDQWQTETQEIIWTNDATQNANYLITAWLNILDEEHIINKKVSLQSAMLAPSNDLLFLSFDRNIFSKQNSTYTKLLLIESLLKTLTKNDLKLQQVQFLVHHQPMQDHHLDFSNPWPLSGFIKS